jgi:hypothetical protein
VKRVQEEAAAKKLASEAMPAREANAAMTTSTGPGTTGEASLERDGGVKAGERSEAGKIQRHNDYGKLSGVRRSWANRAI